MNRRSKESDLESRSLVDPRGDSSIELEDEEAPQLIDDDLDPLLDDDSDSSPGDRRRDPLRRP